MELKEGTKSLIRREQRCEQRREQSGKSLFTCSRRLKI
nr:MAG TPA: hypothetical protein [Caudoviricetes sp.]